MKKCLDCNRDISDSANRTIRCESCQKEFRKHKDIHINKRRGTARRTASLNKWSKELMKLTNDEVSTLITLYKKKLKHANNEKERLDIKTRMKIMTTRYKQLANKRGAKKTSALTRAISIRNNKCTTCRFNNSTINKCILGNDEYIDCNDYKYDNEIKYKELNEINENVKDIEEQYPWSGFHNYEMNESDIHKLKVLPHSERINWDKAKTGWTQYYDDGLVTLSPDVFFGKWKVNE